MNSSPLKRLTSAERRRRVLRAALRVFGRDGYDEASMNAIAAASGVTKPVLYDHFPSKDALYVAVLEGVRDDLLASGAKALRLRADRQAQIQAAVDAFFLFAERRPEALRALLLTPLSSPRAAALSKSVQESAAAGISALLKPHVRSGEEWRAAVVAEFLKSGLHAAALWWADHPGIERERLSATIGEVVWGGLSSLDLG
jgi:AcrR family transcriptional regulator